MDKYHIVEECMKENGCVLLTTYEEFEEKRQHVLKKYYHYVRVDFIGTCLHPSSVVFTNFIRRKTGITCKECVRIKCSTREKEHTHTIESDGIAIIEEQIKEHYRIVRTKEGCRADLAIQLHTETEDKWIPIQVKVTQKISHGMYSFQKVKNIYKDMLIVCLAVQEQKMWLIPYNEIDGRMTASLNISMRSTYNQYKVDRLTFRTQLESYQSNITLHTCASVNIPVALLQQREQLYVKKRETLLPFLPYEYPVIQQTAVDVMINGKRIQEKVLGYDHKKLSLLAHMGCNNGVKQGKRQLRSYQLGENDYYWLHSSIDERFWIIPEGVLYEHGIITAKGVIGPMKHVCMKSKYKKWLQDYEYDYTAINVEKIRSLFVE
jgi:hypothetical protein